MRLAIIGASGLVGSHMVDIFPKNFEILKVSNKDNLATNEISWSKFFSSFLVTPQLHIDVIVICSQSNSFNSPADSEYFTELKFLIEKSHAELVIFFSTGGLYQFGQYPVNESTNFRNSNDMDHYYHSKYAGESIMSTISSPTKIAFLRPFFVFGPHQKSKFLFPRITHSIVHQKPILLESYNGPLINPIYVHDVVNITKRIVLDHKTFFKNTTRITLNLAGQDSFYLRDLVHSMSRIMRFPSPPLCFRIGKDLNMTSALSDFVIECLDRNKSFKQKILESQSEIFFKNSTEIQ